MAWIVTLVGWAPVIGVLLCAALAHLAGCEVNEGDVQPCRVAGLDLGGLLYVLGVFGWGFLVTLPLAVFSPLLWLLVAILGLRARRAPR